MKCCESAKGDATVRMVRSVRTVLTLAAKAKILGVISATNVPIKRTIRRTMPVGSGRKIAL
jgi:hypothetical protein